MITLRLATPADAEPLAVLGARTFVDTFVHGFGIPYPADDLAVYMTRAYSPDAIRPHLLDPARHWLVAERGGELVGFAESGPCGLPHPDASAAHGELKRLYLARSVQGQGLGPEMLRRSLEWLEARDAGPLWIGVWSGNERAQRLYESRGFRKVGEYDYPVGAWLDREHILRRG